MTNPGPNDEKADQNPRSQRRASSGGHAESGSRTVHPRGSRQSAAYSDRALPIGYGQTISQPYIVALMTELLELRGSEKVLEIGTGCGYQTAILAELAKQVLSIEIIPELAGPATTRLLELGYTNVMTRLGDGYRGWPEEAPFDAIMVTCSPEDVPPAAGRSAQRREVSS